MGYWGKVLGGVAGFALGGPLGAITGAALGHAADTGAVRLPTPNNLLHTTGLHPARIATLFAPPDQVFAVGVTSLSAKLAKIDGPVSRAEIDAFKRAFRIPDEAARGVARLFDQARQTPEDFEGYAKLMGETFLDNRGMLEDVLAALFGIARADGPVNAREQDFLARTARGFRLDSRAWDRARSGAARPRVSPEGPDPYAVLGVARTATDEEVRAAWKGLMRENHPDSLASRGVPPEFVAKANDKVAEINAAWDRVKRERAI